LFETAALVRIQVTYAEEKKLAIIVKRIDGSALSAQEWAH
jgi:hypothetical protein